jgi:hypothetical protein
MITRIKTLSNIIKEIGLISEAKSISDLDRFVYSFVPSEDIDNVLEFGLASTKHIIGNKLLLKKIFPDKKERLKWIDLYDEDDITTQGPNVFFQKPDVKKIKKMNPEHPIFEREMELLRIDFSSLREDFPDMKVFGLEMIPYEDNEYLSKKDKIEKYLSDTDINAEMDKSFDDAWSDYKPLPGFFAPNIPHGVIIIKKNIIPKEYITVE